MKIKIYILIFPWSCSSTCAFMISCGRSSISSDPVRRINLVYSQCFAVRVAGCAGEDQTASGFLSHNTSLFVCLFLVVIQGCLSGACWLYYSLHNSEHDNKPQDLFQEDEDLESIQYAGAPEVQKDSFKIVLSSVYSSEAVLWIGTVCGASCSWLRCWLQTYA